jgi:hypothetical protein
MEQNMRIKSLFILASLLFLMLLTGNRVSAQTLDELLRSDDGGIVNDETCKGTPLAGAASVRVIVRSNEEVLLVGARGNRVVWKKHFPLPEEVNTPKTNPVCKGRTIELYSQFPFSAYTRIYTFNWDGRTLKYISTRSEDPSAEALEEAISAAETGNVRKLNSLYEEENYLPIFYPFHYIGSSTLAEAIKRGHTAATRLYKAGKSRQAADRLALMFDLTVNLARTVSGDDFDSTGPDKWLQAWKSLEVPAEDYTYALNDHGFFLQEAGEHDAAISIFNLVIKESPERAVAYLNLADSLWALDHKAEARSHYQTYRRLMTEENKGAQIPPRVAERSG